jgi:hypothetical protein
MCVGCESAARPSSKVTALLAHERKHSAQHASRSRSDPPTMEKGPCTIVCQ